MKKFSFSVTLVTFQVDGTVIEHFYHSKVRLGSAGLEQESVDCGSWIHLLICKQNFMGAQLCLFIYVSSCLLLY